MKFNLLNVGMFNMKNKLIFFVICLSFIYSICFAITKDDVVIGGVGPGCTLAYVINIYGEPIARQPDHSGNIPKTIYCFGNSNTPSYYVITEDNTGVVVEVINTGATNLKTPDGVGCGSSENDVRMIYGQTPTNDTVFNGEGGMMYTTQDQQFELVFFIKNGRVTSFGAKWLSR